MARRTALNYVHPGRLTLPIEDTPAKEGIPYEDIVLTTADNVSLQGWYTPPQNGVVILVAHGYGGARDWDMHILFAKHGYGVVSWDFRAHGKSGGDTSTVGYYEVLDVEAALDFALKQPGVEHIGAWGGSMGAATVILTAAQRPEIEAVVADSAFAALEDELDIMIKVTWLRPFIRFFAEQELGELGIMGKVRPIDVIHQISPRPILIIQGLNDGMIPIDSGERLFNASGQPRSLWTEDEVNHVGMRTKYPKEYEDRVIGFFNEMMLAPISKISQSED